MLEESLETLKSIRSTMRQVEPPVFNGTGDVENFLTQFREVAELNRWSTGEYALHLQLSLKGSAQECCEMDMPHDIEHHLRAKFGPKIRQARDQLKTLRQGPQQSTRELGTQARRLVRAAYPNWCPRDVEELALEAFIQALRCKTARQYLLALTIRDINEATDLLHCYEYAVDGHPEKSRGQPAVQTKTANRKSMQCFRCNGPHYKRDCPKFKNQGNFPRPATQA